VAKVTPAHFLAEWRGHVALGEFSLPQIFLPVVRATARRSRITLDLSFWKRSASTNPVGGQATSLQRFW